jgi:FixJ family two-component response regulator
MTDATVFLIDDDASVRDALGLLLSLKGLRTQLFAAAC